jgi:hypothetical protein
MAIKLKGSAITGKAPLASDLVERQLAVNTADGYLFTKHIDGSIKDIKTKVADLATNATTSANCTGNANTASSCTGNSATATKLATARKINGVNFDGTQDINIDAGGFKLVHSSSVTLPYTTWVDTGFTVGTNSADELYVASFSWSYNDGSNYSYYAGSTGVFNTVAGLLNSLALMRYADNSSDYATCVGGGSYGEGLYWRIKTQDDAKLQINWFGRAGFSNANPPVSCNIRVWKL